VLGAVRIVRSANCGGEVDLMVLLVAFEYDRPVGLLEQVLAT
jgi:hypothetical protein